MYHMLAFLTSCIMTTNFYDDIPKKCKPIVDTTYYSAKECYEGSRELTKNKTVKVICLERGKEFTKKPEGK